MASIKKIQQNIVNEFALLGDNREMTIMYIMELGEQLPPMDETTKSDNNLIKGCQSKVWITAFMKDEKVFFQADSNTNITKGLVSLLVQVFSGQSPDDILQTDLTFMEDIGMSRFVGTRRSSGLASMIKQMKLYALALKTRFHNRE